MPGKQYPMFQNHNMIREHPMSFEERNAVSGILVCFVTWAIMLTVLLQKSAAGVFEGIAGLEAELAENFRGRAEAGKR